MFRAIWSESDTKILKDYIRKNPEHKSSNVLEAVEVGKIKYIWPILEYNQFFINGTCYTIL
jgi:hypothetical protein